MPNIRYVLTCRAKPSLGNLSCLLNFFGLFFALIGLFLTFLGLTQNFNSTVFKYLGPATTGSGVTLLFLGIVLWLHLRRMDLLQESIFYQQNDLATKERPVRRYWYEHKPTCPLYRPPPGEYANFSDSYYHQNHSLESIGETSNPDTTYFKFINGYPQSPLETHPDQSNHLPDQWNHHPRRHRQSCPEGYQNSYFRDVSEESKDGRVEIFENFKETKSPNPVSPSPASDPWFRRASDSAKVKNRCSGATGGVWLLRKTHQSAIMPILNRSKRSDEEFELNAIDLPSIIHQEHDSQQTTVHQNKRPGRSCSLKFNANDSIAHANQKQNPLQNSVSMTRTQADGFSEFGNYDDRKICHVRFDDQLMSGCDDADETKALLMKETTT